MRVLDSHPNVMLRGVTEAQFSQLLEELRTSTSTGREIAHRIEKGQLHVTLDSEGFTAKHAGIATPKEIHIAWSSSVQETARLAIHEAVHQADPSLQDPAASRAEIEADARVHEYQYSRLRGLEPYDEAEVIYRAVLDEAIRKGMPDLAALKLARQAMIDMMRADPERYAIEPSTGDSSSRPAKAPAKPEAPGIAPPFTSHGAHSRTTAAGVVVTSKTMNLSGDTAGTGGILSIRGERGSDGTTAIEIKGELQPPLPRNLAPNYNDDALKASDLADATVAGYEAAHLWGPGYGDEARDGIMLAPREVNQWLQNEGIESRLRELKQLAGPGATVLVTARAESHPTNTTRGHQFLKHVSYRFAIQIPGERRPREVGQVDIDVPAPPANPNRIEKEVTGGSALMWSLS